MIESKNYETTKAKRKELILQNHFENEMINFYDLDATSLENVLEDLDTYSFLTPKKVIVLSNCHFLRSSDIKFSEEEINHLLKYLKNPNSDVLFIMEVSSCDERKKLVKQIKECVNVIQLEVKPWEYCKEIFQGYQIQNTDISLILEYCQNDIDKITKECEKLKLYRMEEKKISREDIENLVIKSMPDINQLSFDFVKAIANKNKVQIFNYYDLLGEYHFEIHSIIGLIESQLRLIYQVMIGRENHLSREDIGKKLNEHPYRVQKTYEFLHLYSEDEIRQMIHRLHELDFKIKSGMLDAKTGFEMFLLSI